MAGSEATSRIIPFQFARNSVIYFGSQVASKGFFYLTTIFLARQLGPAEYGQFAFAFALVTIFSVLSKFGLDLLTSSDVGADPQLAPKYFAGGFQLRVLLSIGMLLLLFPVTLVFQKPVDVFLLVVFLAFATVSNTIAGSSTSLLEGSQLFLPRSILNVCMYGFVFVGVVAIFIAEESILTAGIAFLAASVLYLGVAFTFCHRKVTPFRWTRDREFLWSLFRRALPLGFSDIFISIYYRADTVLLSVYHTDSIVGWYDAAYSFVYGLRLIPVSFALVLLPRLSEIHTRDANQATALFIRVVRYSAVVGILLTALVAFQANRFVSLCFGPGYEPSAGVLPVLIWTAAIMFITALQGVWLVATGRRNMFFIATAAGAVSNIVMNLLLIPQWNMYGAAVATVASELIVLLINTCYTWKSLKWNK